MKIEIRKTKKGTEFHAVIVGGKKIGAYARADNGWADCWNIIWPECRGKKRKTEREALIDVIGRALKNKTSEIAALSGALDEA